MSTKILYLTYVEDNQNFSKTSLEIFSGALKLADDLNSEIDIGIIGGEGLQSSAQIFSSDKVSKYYGVQGLEFKYSRYESDVIGFEAICKKSNPDLVIAPSCSRINKIISGLSFRCNGNIDTHVAEINLQDNNLVIKRWFYKQRIISELTRDYSKETPWFLTCDSGTFTKWQPTENKNIEVELLDISIDNPTSSFIDYKEPPEDEQTIKPDAEYLFVAGAGWTKNQPDGKPHIDKATNIILDFLKKSGASLGGSKSLVDISGEGGAVLPFMSHLNQVGQTGASPRHPKGLSTCCHGEEPHVIGWRFINEIRAINLDPNCGWARGKADIVYVADAFKLMAMVNEML